MFTSHYLIPLQATIMTYVVFLAMQHYLREKALKQRRNFFQYLYSDWITTDPVHFQVQY